MHFSKEFWKVLASGIVLIVLVTVGFYAWFYYTRYLHEQEVKQVNLQIVAVQKELYKSHLAGEFGGVSPYEVLYSYSEALERKDYEIASTYFVKPVRAEALRVLQDASPGEVSSFVGVLDDALLRIKDVTPSESTFSISSPISVSFELVGSGVWEIRSIQYPFQ